MIARIVLAPLVLAAVTAGVGAQPKPGDLLVSSDTGVRSIDRVTGAEALVGPLPSNSRRSVWMAANNTDIRIVDQARPLIFGRMSPSGVLVSAQSYATSMYSGMAGMTLDQDGRFIAGFVTSRSAAVVRLSASGLFSTVALFSSGAGFPTIDRDSGDIVVARSGTTSPSGAHLLRMTGSAITTLTTLPFPGVVSFDDASGNYAVVGNASSTVSDYLVLDQNGGTVLQWQGPGGFYSVTTDPETGNLFLVRLDDILEVTLKGAVLRTWPVKREHSQVFRSIAIYGSHKLVGSGSARPGTTYSLRLSMPGSAGRPYRAAMSLSGLRPAIPLPGRRTINLAIDALARVTIGNGDIPGVTQGLRGRLDANGSATIAVKLPASAPVGLRLFVAAVAENPAFPGGIDVAPSAAFSVR